MVKALVMASHNSKTKSKGLIEIMTGATEFENIPIRHNEHSILKKVINDDSNIHFEGCCWAHVISIYQFIRLHS